MKRQYNKTVKPLTKRMTDTVEWSDSEGAQNICGNMSVENWNRFQNRFGGGIVDSIMNIYRDGILVGVRLHIIIAN